MSPKHVLSPKASAASPGDPRVTACPTQPPHSPATAAAQTAPVQPGAGCSSLPATPLLSTTASKALGFLLEAADGGPMVQEAPFSAGLPRQPPAARCLHLPSRLLSPLRPQSTGHRAVAVPRESVHKDTRLGQTGRKQNTEKPLNFASDCRQRQQRSNHFQINPRLGKEHAKGKGV